MDIIVRKFLIVHYCLFYYIFYSAAIVITLSSIIANPPLISTFIAFSVKDSNEVCQATSGKYATVPATNVVTRFTCPGNTQTIP